ncbi:hypothetical protein L202_07169 [Cryptococcus amylolentus CBS 6039]|uniref:Uncharacterized protein n=2 Tax=Cryptococcus amylolentus TaxID=104669 RepID=A0A1E3HFG3_9TREE|nr:hypothetical protein L202_07169 [Cryptococcus amylolentus CBS 6039]ODN74865.1 hypothetical protein L202_07169 [Cryptococcus amylolentus CBS 6039]
MQHISSWERIGYLPFTHAHPFPPNYKSLVNNPCKPPSRRWILKGMDHSAPLDPYVRCESPFSALYIFYVKKILELHEEGFEDRWFAMWDNEPLVQSSAVAADVFIWMSVVVALFKYGWRIGGSKALEDAKT